MSCHRVSRELLERLRFGELDRRAAPHIDHLAGCARFFGDEGRQDVEGGQFGAGENVRPARGSLNFAAQTKPFDEIVDVCQMVEDFAAAQDDGLRSGGDKFAQNRKQKLEAFLVHEAREALARLSGERLPST